MPVSTITFTPARHDIVIYAGADYAAEYQFLTDGVPLDLTGMSADCEIMLDDVRHQLNASVTAATGTVTVTLGRSVTKNLEIGSGRWDLYLADNVRAMPYLSGTCKVTATVSEVA